MNNLDFGALEQLILMIGDSYNISLDWDIDHYIISNGNGQYSIKGKNLKECLQIVTNLL